MFNRRQFFAAAVLAAAPFIPIPALASPSDAILTGLVAGVTDAAVSAYIQKHYKDARWDGRYFYEGDRRYSRDEWRRELERRHYAEAHRQPSPKPQPKPKKEPKKKEPPKP